MSFKMNKTVKPFAIIVQLQNEIPVLQGHRFYWPFDHNLKTLFEIPGI
jgi:hypothetical protein